MRHCIRECEIVPNIDVRRVAEQPRRDVAYSADARQDEDSKHRVVDREDSQKSPNVKLAGDVEATPRILFGEIAAIDQDASYEKAAEDEEQPDTQLCPVHLAEDPDAIRRL